MRVRIIALAICGFFAVSGCQSNNQNKGASVNDAPNVVKNSATANIAASDDVPKISRQQYDEIKLGMSKAEVEKIIGAGKPGKSVADENTAGDTYRWSIGGGMLISITFENGKVKDIAEKF